MIEGYTTFKWRKMVALSTAQRSILGITNRMRLCEMVNEDKASIYPDMTIILVTLKSPSTFMFHFCTHRGGLQRISEL